MNKKLFVISKKEAWDILCTINIAHDEGYGFYTSKRLYNALEKFIGWD